MPNSTVFLCLFTRHAQTEHRRETTDEVTAQTSVERTVKRTSNLKFPVASGAWKQVIYMVYEGSYRCEVYALPQVNSMLFNQLVPLLLLCSSPISGALNTLTLLCENDH